MLCFGRRFGVLALFTAVASCGGESPTDAPDTPVLALSDVDVGFTALAGGPAPATEVIDVTNTGTGTLGGLSASVTYEAGEPTGWLSATLSGVTAPATLTLDASTTTTSAGVFSAEVVVSAGAAGADTVAVSLLLSLDTPPTITVTSPSRAATLEAGTYVDSDVQITGQACHDAAPITELAVNGTSLPVAGTNLCESFDVAQSAPWGYSTFSVHAVNAFGRSADVVQAYLRSPAFQSGALPPAFVEHGIYAQMNQALFDDSDALPDDLAGFLEAVPPSSAYAFIPTTLADTDVLEGYVPFCTDQLVITKRGLNWADVQADVTAAADGLHVKLTIQNLTVAARASYTGCFGGQTVVDGVFTAGQAVIQGTATASLLATGIDVSLSSLTFALSGADLTFSGGALASEVLNFISTTGLAIVTSQVGNGLRSWLAGLAGQLVESQLMSLQARLPSTADTLGLTGSYQFDFVQHIAGAVRLGLALRAQPTDAPSTPSPSHGAILTDPGIALPTFSTIAYEFGTGVKLDAINQLLWSAWRSGAFDVADLSVPTVPGVTGSAVALLPPVMVAGTGTQIFDLGWGDVSVTASVDRSVFGLPGGTAGPDVEIAAYGSARLGLTITFDASAYAFVALDVQPDVQVQVVGLNELLDEQAIAAALESALEAAMVDLAKTAVASIPVPEMDLDSFVPGLKLGLGASVPDLDGVYLTLTGNMAVRP